MPLTFIHAADFHLGANLRRFGQARRRVEKAQFGALDRTLAAAVERQAAFILICGDLFDSRNPPPSAVSQAASLFEKYRHVPVYIIPGTHDFLSRGAILSPGHADWAPENVRIFTDPKSSPFHIEEIGTYIHFRPNTTNRSKQSPIAGIKRSAKSGIHIGLAHGSLATGSPFSYEYPIDPAEIETTGLDYLALGHWHSPRIARYGKTVAAYSGIPQPLSFSDPETGSVFHVECAPGSPCTPTGIETSTIRLKRISARIYHPRDVKKLFDSIPTPNTVLKLNLKYSDNCTERLEIARIIENAKSRYVLVQEENKPQKQPDAAPPSPGDVNHDLIDSYKAELERLREADSPERATIYEKALELGTRIIKGDV